VIASVHLADLSPRASVRALRAQPKVGSVAGLRYADLMFGAPLSPSVLPTPAPGRFGLFSLWEDDAALDRWEAGAPLARLLDAGWRARLEPLRTTTNGWTGMPPLLEAEQPVADDEPVAVLTYGRLDLRAAPHFLRSSATAEAAALDHGAMVASTGLARPPRLVATFSLWRSAAEMRDYAYRGAGHTGAMREMRRRHFHHEWLFARFRPYAVRGRWVGREPLSEHDGAPAGAVAGGGGAEGRMAG
jgi:hypothetical protein